MTDREVMQMALDALEAALSDDKPYISRSAEAIEALRTALAQPEPVAMKFQIYKQTPPRGRELESINSALLPWVYDQDPSSGNTASMWVTPVATLPSKKEWVGLTSEEIFKIWSIIEMQNDVMHEIKKFARAIEAQLKDKNT